MAFLARAWQILLKGISEIQIAPSSKQAVEMVFVRLTFASNLPTPEETIRLYENKKKNESSMEQLIISNTSGENNVVESELDSKSEKTNNYRKLENIYKKENKNIDEAVPKNFEEVLKLADKKREAILRTHLLMDIHIVHFEVGYIELNLGENAPKDLAVTLSEFLNEETNISWKVSISKKSGEPSLNEKRKTEEESMLLKARSLPLVRAVLETFPETTVEKVSDLKLREC